MKIKKITYKIVPGKWKSVRMAQEFGLYSYPILLTCIEDSEGKVIEIPLSYNDIADLLQKQIYLERYVDSFMLRKPYSHKVKDGLNMSMNFAQDEPIERVREFIDKRITFK